MYPKGTTLPQDEKSNRERRLNETIGRPGRALAVDVSDPADLQRLRNVIACLKKMADEPSQRWNKGQMRATAHQLFEMLDVDKHPAKSIGDDDCPF